MSGDESPVSEELTGAEESLEVPPSLPKGKKSFWKMVFYKTPRIVRQLCSSRYLKANLVNLVYGVVMMVMDIAVYSSDLEGLVYFLLAVVHCINAYMYLWMWRGEHQDIFTMFCLPDWLNGLCALFYLGTGFCAPYMYDEYDEPTDIFRQVRRIELFLSVLECVAAIGWVYQWYTEYALDLRLRPKQCQGRGWTLDDPDLWANASLIIAAIYYITYNVVISIDNYQYYNTCSLYFWGDFWYLINAICYVLCAMRDCDCFWFMPVGGKFPDFDRMAFDCGLYEAEDESLDVKDNTSEVITDRNGLSARLRAGSHLTDEADVTEVDDRLPLLAPAADIKHR